MMDGWRRWTAAGLLAGGLLVAGGCFNREEREGPGAFRTPIQDKYQPEAGEVAETYGGAGWQAHPSVDEEERAEQARPHKTETRQLTAPRPLGEGLGRGLEETYDAPAPR